MGIDPRIPVADGAREVVAEATGEAGGMGRELADGDRRPGYAITQPARLEIGNLAGPATKVRLLACLP